MSDSEGLNDSTPLQTSIDSAPAPPSDPGPSTPAVQASGAQEPIPNGTVAPEVSTGQPFFGVLKQGANYYQHPVFNDNYEERFPEDPYGEETAPNARVWRTLVEEAAAFDAVFVGQARDGLDVMLVFAGLFSAVVTSFLVQVSQSLQADYTAMSAMLLHDLVAIQLSIAEGASSLLNITAPSVNPFQTFRPDSITVWVNGLWVVSLTASLVVALSAVLVKQWLHHYTSIPSGTPGARSHLRQYRLIGLQKWRVSIIIGVLPIVMHTSLALFLAGLMLFFIPLRTSLACAVSIFTVALCLLYLVSSAMPIFFPQCPYQTPLTDFIHHTCLIIRKTSYYISGHVRRLVYDMLLICPHWIHCFLHLDILDIQSSRFRPHGLQRSPTTLNQLEMMAVKANYDTLSVDALNWLFNVSSNPTVHSLVVQAIGGLPPDVEVYARATWEDQDEIRSARDRQCLQSHEGDGSMCLAIGYESVCERLNRSLCFLPGGYWAKSLSDEPWSTAAAWAARAPRVSYWHIGTQSCGRDLRKFFCTFNKLELHPLIWVVLVRSALTDNSPYNCFQVDSSKDLSGQDYAHIISLFLPASKVPDEPLSVRHGTGQSTSTVTLHGALTFRLGDISESVQGCLLKMLSSVDDHLSPMLPPRYRLLYKAGKYALHYVADELCTSHTDVGSCHHLQLLTDVLRTFHAEYNTILEEYPCFLAPIFNLLCAIIDNTPICDYNAAGWQHPKLHDLLSNSLSANSLSVISLSVISLSAIIRLSTDFALSGQPEFVSQSFHRLLQVPAYRWQHLSFALGYDTVTLMERALAVGNEAMYRAFIDGEWMWILSEMYIADYDNQDIYCCYRDDETTSTFIRGLQRLSSASAHKFFEYVHQPRNFIITFIRIMIASGDLAPRSPTLLKLCPKDSSWWDKHRTTLDGIINWCQAPNRDDLPFPLEDFFNGKVVQMKNRAVSLDEALGEMFAHDRYRRRFEWAARTIILGEAAPDPDSLLGD